MRVGQKPTQHLELDETDRKIVALLQEDGRRPAADIARIIGTSVQTVTNRIDRLVESAVIDVMAILNPPSIGWQKDALICMRVRQGFLRSVGDRLAELECVSYVGFLTGSFDLMIEVYVRDDEDLFRFMTEELSQVKEIEATEVWTVLHTGKYNYAWSNPVAEVNGDSNDAQRNDKESARSRARVQRRGLASPRARKEPGNH
jgi:Lrp/AsnC family transcriptional regulator, regulator for asnA, asnC and gidA